MGLFDMFKSKKKEAPKKVVKKAPAPVKEMSLNLSKRVAKSTEELTLCLKKNNMEGIRARVQVAMDESGSMEFGSGLYSGGFVQRTFERLMPIGLKFDDNKAIECYTFNRGYREHDEITLNNLDGYVRNVIGRIEGGGTSYAPIIEAMTKRHIQTQKEENDGLPTFVIFMTDGDNGDKAQTRKAIIEASKQNIFFMFIGMGDNEPFEFLEELDDMEGREKDNADFEAILNIDNLTDKQLYDIFLREFKDFVKLSK